MINSLNSYKYAHTPNFCGFNGYTSDSVSKNKQQYSIHETAFFRDLDTMQFAAHYITKNFSNGTNIADFACSNGEEAYTLLMLLNQNNKDKKYKITGFDISPTVLEKAQTGPFRVEPKYQNTEGFILSNPEFCDEYERPLRQVFHECFSRVPEQYFTYRFQNGSVQSIEDKISQERDLNKLLELKCFREIVADSGFSFYNAFIPKKDFVENSFDVKQGDISDISDLIKADGKTGVVFFKNAWYHILGSKLTYDTSRLNMDGADRIIKSVHRILPENGIFVVGSLINDHLFHNQKGNLKIQNGIEIEAYESSPFHDLLRQNGFKPIFYEKIKNIADKTYQTKVHLPSVWKKF